MEGKKKPRNTHDFLGCGSFDVESGHSYSLDGSEFGHSIPTSLSSSDSPPKNPFRFPPPPFFAQSSRISANHISFENGESDNSLTTGSASDIEDNSDSQSDAAGLASSSIMLANDHGSHCQLYAQKESGSQSDTGFGGVSGSSSIKLRSSPVPIHRPFHSVRGYESDSSPVGLRSQANFLPPIGVFWDIENCQVPKGRSAVAVAQLIREKFFEGRREAEFLVVCDVKKENAQIVSELNDAQVNLIHVSATCKNAADEKLRQSIRRFAEIYGSPAAIILISGDVNFAADLTDLRHRKKIHVILIHNNNTSETLILCANEHYNFSGLVENLPLRGAFKSGNQPVEVIIFNIPPDKDMGKVKNRLRKLSDNCGGRVGQIIYDRAIIRFPSIEFATRAQRRMDGQDVLGNKILVSRPQKVSLKEQESPLKSNPDRNRVRRLPQRFGEDLKISNLPLPQDLNHYSQIGSTPSTSQGMYLSKGFGNGSKIDGVTSSLASSASLASSIGSTSLAGNLSNSALPFNISQTGIGTANFYKNTPPPRIVLGNVPSTVSKPSHSLNQSVMNGWNHGINAGGSLSSGSPQPQMGETFPTMYAKAACTLQQQQQQQRQYQLSQQVWQSSSNGKLNPSSLQVASQSLSLLTANLSNSGTGDFTPDLWKHVSEPPQVQADSLAWEEVSSGLQPHISPLRGCTAPQTRTPSPSAQSSVSAQIHSTIHSRTGGGDGVQWSTQLGSNGSGTLPKSRTPSPYSLNVDQLYQTQVNRRSWGSTTKTSPVMDIKEPDRYFNPIQSQARHSSQGGNGPVELQVTNLDQNMDPKEMKRVLQAVFREHVSVLHISVFVQSDGNLAATVRVQSLQDAQYAISQLHRKKVGFKRIQISYSQNGPTINPALVRSQIVSLLQEVPGHRLPLFKFREMFENRYLTTISVSDMYKLRDVCLVSEEPNGRMVSLNPQHRNTPSPLMAGAVQQDGQAAMELPYCTQHYQKPNTQDKGWAEQELATLPNVNVGLKLFTQRVHSLLQSHGGSLPLPSFAHCYSAQFGPLEVDDGGVALEHLVSCVSGIELYQGVGCVKYLRWACGADNETANDTDGSSVTSNVSPPLAGPLALFSRELVDLLKTAPNCQISFNRFIPAYHHHFGRQCRVADYGYTKLMPLLEALPNIVQVLGEGNKRMVTLSHRAQVRRFTSDLLRVLKAQYSKQVTLSEFPAAYQRVLNRPFEVVNYGVCRAEDLLSEVAETTVLVSSIQNSKDVLIAIPKREQTQEEMEKTKQFATEVLQLLQYAPQCSMDFSKFIPYYHHHFGKQCRVSDYGFSKLIELFEAIPDVVKVSEGDEGDRRVQLTLNQRLQVLGDIVASIVQEYGHSFMPLSAVSEYFLLNSGYALRPEDYGFNSLEDLFSAIHFSVKLHFTTTGTFVGLVDQSHLHSISLNVRRILWTHEDGRMKVSEFKDCYQTIIGSKCNFDDLLRDFKDILEVKVVQDVNGSVEYVCLKPLQMFARNVYQLLQDSEGRLPLSSFETSYIQRFGKAVQPAQYGFSSVSALLQALHDIITVKGKGQRRFLVLEHSQNDNTSNLNETKGWTDLVPESCDYSSPKKTLNLDHCSVGESPDTVLKKLIRNLSNQPSPAKQRLFGASGGAQGYRPLGFATSQQPLHNNSNHHFAWGPPQTSNGGYSSFTLPISIPCSLDSTPSLLPNGFDEIESTSPPSPHASLPVVQPPHPSELPMPRLALASPTVPHHGDNVNEKSNFLHIKDQEEKLSITDGSINSSIIDEATEGTQDGAPGSNQDASQNAGRSKRKQRLAIQFSSPLVPIQ
ncbi:meiosis regulator and mRNA stability factor 1 isoform X2 [Frankliniella occidentalis]|uniref:Meiosis regulator and mRNA stability factor 1 isoform X2 n=1 Tax=Frankliniella occidentalis TaxID=133901 RepID=A0A6J1S237_FRAOC|nr:meiosis regulator and mRNA stability factor 1 isoform X2 [Frankliniella occidentalis]